MSAYTYLTVDNIVSGRPCLLYKAVLTANADGAADVTLYDERSAVTGREIIVVNTAASSTTSVGFEGLELQRGLYVDVGSNVTSVTIEWEPLGSEKEQAV